MTKAFLPASVALNFSYQKPISRYEERPTNSQKIYNCSMVGEKVKFSMAQANRDIKA